MSLALARSRLRGARRLLLRRDLPLRARLGLVALGVRRRAGRPRPAVWAFGPGRVRLAPADGLDVDWRVLSEIFVSDVYATSFAGVAVVDAGAHKGYFGAYALLRGARVVVSVEPESRNHAALADAAASLRMPGRTWIAHRGAVGADDGEATLLVDAESWAHRTVDRAPDHDAVERVPRLGLARLLAEAGAHACQRLIVKLDVEGDECAVVLGTPADAWGAVDEVLVELHDAAPCGARELEAHLAAAGLARADTRPGDVVRFTRAGAPPAPAPRSRRAASAPPA